MTDLAPLNLSRPSRAGLEALVGVVTPPGEAHQLGVFGATVEETVLIIRAMPTVIRVALSAGMWVYELFSVFVPRNRLKRASRLGPERALAYFGSWLHGVALARNFIKGIKGLIGLAYYEQLPVQEHIGYRPRPWIEQARRKRLALHSDAIAQHQASLFESDPLPLPGEVSAAIAAAASAVEPTERADEPSLEVPS